MIVNLPSSEEFDELAKNCLVQAFDIIFDTDKAIFDVGQKALQKDVWRYSQGKLNTAVVLIHQAIESFMKAGVCCTSPLLLLEGRRKEWPVLPAQIDKDFNSFYTTPAEDLLRTYAATAKAPLSSDIVEHIEAIRTLRNQIVHGISRIEMSPRRLIESVLDTYMFFLGKDVWWSSLLSEHINHPLAEHHEFEMKLSSFAERLDYVEASIGKAKFAKQFSYNVRARRYICPFCRELWSKATGGDHYPYSWAFLDNTNSKEPLVRCLNCKVESPVYRHECYYTDCKGSVRCYGEMPEDIFCLTCGYIQYEGTEAEDRAKREEAERAFYKSIHSKLNIHSDQDVEEFDE